MGKGKVSYASAKVGGKFQPTYEELADDWALNKVCVSKNAFWWIGGFSALGGLGLTSGPIWLSGISLFIIFWWAVVTQQDDSEYNYLKELELYEAERRKKNE